MRRPAPRAVPILLGLTLVLTPLTGWPHASLLRSTPARRAVLVRAPDRVQLWFNERVEPQFSWMSVWDARGQQVDLGDLRVAADDPRMLSVAVPASLPPGPYVVKFRVLSVDGHVVEGQFPFTVQGR